MCIYTCIDVYTYTYMYIYIYRYVHIRIYVYMYVYTQTHITPMDMSRMCAQSFPPASSGRCGKGAAGGPECNSQKTFWDSWIRVWVLGMRV